MELDTFKHIWKQQQAEAGADFNKEKIIKKMENRIKGSTLDDKSKKSKLVLAIICMLGFVLSLLFHGFGVTDDLSFSLIWAAGALVGLYHYKGFNQTPLHNQPLDFFLKNLLKRIRMQRFARIIMILAAIPFYWKTFLSGFLTIDLSSWTTQEFIGLGTTLFIFAFVLIALRWYQQNFDTGSLKDLEKEIKGLLPTLDE